MDTHESGSQRSRLVRALLLGAAGVVLIAAAGVRWSSPAAAPSQAAQTTVVLAAHHLEAGQVLAAADLDQVNVSTSSMDSALLHDPAEARGRRLLIGLPAGAPLVAAILAPPEPPVDQRLIRIEVDADHVAGDVQTGALVEVLAVVDAPQGPVQSGRQGQLVTVGTATVVDMTWASSTGASRAGTSDSAPPSRAAPGTSLVIVALRCDVTMARRLIWAEISSRALRIAARSPAEATTPAAFPAGATP